VRQAVETGMALTSLRFAMGRRTEAVGDARTVIELLETQVSLLEKRGGARRIGALVAGVFDGGRVARLESLLKGLDQTDLATRLGSLRERLQPPDRGERPGTPGSEPRRGGK